MGRRARATIRCGSSCRLLRWTRDQGHRAVAAVGPDLAHPKLLEFAEANQIPIAKDKRGEAPFSVDANLLHTSSEGKVLENPAEERPSLSISASFRPRRPDQAEMVEITFEKGDAVAINGEAMSPGDDPARLNDLGGKHGVGVLDLVENRFVGMKSRGLYETPGGTILWRRTGDRADHAGCGRGPPEGFDHAALCRADLQRLLVQPRAGGAAGADRQDAGACHRDGAGEAVQGSARTVARWSDHSLYSEKHVTFEEDAGAYDQKDAEGSSG
jgi:argininosuccinate synthase